MGLRLLSAEQCAVNTQLEATLQKTVFRIIGTVGGGLIGYCVMLKSKAATNPYAIMTIMCTIAFFASFPANTQVRAKLDAGRYLFRVHHCCHDVPSTILDPC